MTIKLFLNKKFLILVLVFLAIGLGILLIKSLFIKPRAGYISGQSDAITWYPNYGNASTIDINFSKCTRGSTGVVFGFGSTSFSFVGISNGNCIFYYGTEIENPNWDGSLPFRCIIPVSLGKQTYQVSQMGIEMGQFENYCKKI